MAQVRCTNCGIRLSMPPGIRTARCPVCYVKVAFTPKTEYIVPAASQYNNYNPTQSNYSYYQPPPQPSAQLLPFSASRNKRALLIAISYRGQKNSVKGSVNDVRMMTHFLVNRLGFPYECILVLTEEERNPYQIPTKRNIQMAMNWLIRGCQSGDSLVFFYSGHGSQVPDESEDEPDEFDEAICPVDYLTEGKILDDEINDTIVRPLPYGAKLHGIVDTCHSGTVLDLPFMCKMSQQGYYGWEDHRISTAYKGTSGGTAICFSACDDHETSLDTTAFTGDTVIGAMTYSFIKAVEYEGGLTYGGLLHSIRATISEAQKRLYGYNAPPPSQVPQLTCSEVFDIYSKPFMI